MNLLVEITLLLFTAGSVLAFVAAAPPVGTAAWLVLHGSRDVDQCRCIAGFAVAGGTGRYPRAISERHACSIVAPREVC